MDEDKYIFCKEHMHFKATCIQCLRTQLTTQSAELARAKGLLLKRSNFYGDEGQLFNKMVEDWKNEDCWSDWDETIYQTRMQIEKEIYDFLHPPAPEGADNAHK